MRKHTRKSTFIRMYFLSSKIKETSKKDVSCVLWMHNTIDVFPYHLSKTIFHFSLQSSGLRPEMKGLSHGLKKCPPDTFLPSIRLGRPFKSRMSK